ncbi:hypothetical protein UT300012_24440 [Paraclostridium bifermentans]
MKENYKLGIDSINKLKNVQRQIIDCLEDCKELGDLVSKEQKDINIEDLNILRMINENVNNLTMIKESLVKIKKYNVRPIDLRELEVGTKFRVINGAWDGEIILMGNNKAISHEHGTLEIVEGNCRNLEIEILDSKGLPTGELYETLGSGEGPEW